MRSFFFSFPLEWKGEGEEEQRYQSNRSASYLRAWRVSFSRYHFTGQASARHVRTRRERSIVLGSIEPNRFNGAEAERHWFSLYLNGGTPRILPRSLMRLSVYARLTSRLFTRSLALRDL